MKTPVWDRWFIGVVLAAAAEKACRAIGEVGLSGEACIEDATEEAMRDYRRRLRAPRKVLIGPWGHYYPEERDAFPGPRIDSRPEYVKWFDRWLKN